MHLLDCPGYICDNGTFREGWGDRFVCVCVCLCVPRTPVKPQNPSRSYRAGGGVNKQEIPEHAYAYFLWSCLFVMYALAWDSFI